jgi:hypothetical protein
VQSDRDKPKKRPSVTAGNAAAAMTERPMLALLALQDILALRPALVRCAGVIDR